MNRFTGQAVRSRATTLKEWESKVKAIGRCRLRIDNTQEREGEVF
jgi:hypothetical protein